MGFTQAIRIVLYFFLQQLAGKPKVTTSVAAIQNCMGYIPNTMNKLLKSNNLIYVTKYSVLPQGAGSF